MRKIRVLSIVIFVIAAGIFVYFHMVVNKGADTAGPVIHMTEESIEVSAEAGAEELLAGITAIDEKDGDVSATLVIESMTNFTEKGRRTATIAAFDSDSNVAKITREIVYSDYHSPSFALDRPLSFPMNAQSFTDGLTASDVLDGDLTQSIKISADGTQLNMPGDYSVVFSVANSAGDVTQLPATLTIYDPSDSMALPSITLSQYLIHINQGEAVDPWAYIDEVSCRGRIYRPESDGAGGMVLAESVEENPDGTGEERNYLNDVEISNPVDANIPGTYEVTYRVSTGGEYQKETGMVRLIVVVDGQEV